MDAVGATLVTSARVRIGTTNVAPDDVAWPQSQRAQAQGGKTLYKDGRLHESINAQAFPDHIAVGSNVPYAFVHQFGAVIRRKSLDGIGDSLSNGNGDDAGGTTIPARPYIGISEEDEATITDVAAAHFQGIIDALSR